MLDNATEWRDAWVTSDDTIASCRELSISGCVVRDVRFTGADLGALHVDNTIFERCDFTNATFEHACFERCDLTEAQFWHASLGGASFPGSRLDAVRGGLAFRGARIDLTQVTDVALKVFEGLEIVVVEE